MPALSNSDGSVASRAVTVGDVMERRRSLRSWLIPPDSDFQLDGLTDIFKDAALLPPHTWLLGLSRHVAVELHNYSPRRKDGPPPPGFPAALDWHRPDCEVTSPWIHYLRVQRARDDSSQRFTAETDCNDFLIRPSRLAGKGPDLDRGSLSELQLFSWPAYAQFYRRVRNLLGVDREYEQIKERLDILFRFAQAEQRARDEKLRDEEIGLGGEEQRLSLSRSHVVEGAAAVVGAVILLVSLANVVVDVAHDFRSVIPNVASIVSLVIAAVGIISFFALRSRVRKIDRDREKARAALARLAREPGTDSSRRGLWGTGVETSPNSAADGANYPFTRRSAELGHLSRLRGKRAWRTQMGDGRTGAHALGRAAHYGRAEAPDDGRR